MPSDAHEPTLVFTPNEHVRSILWGDGTGIQPNDYFVTTGEGIQKAKQLRRDILQVRAQILAANPNLHHIRKTGKEVYQALKEVDQLIGLLTEARGKAVHLQAEWIDGACHCWPKNPRGVRPIQPTDASSTPSPRSDVWAQKLELADAQEIRRLRGTRTVKELAASYGVSPTTIKSVLAGHTHRGG